MHEIVTDTRRGSTNAVEFPLRVQISHPEIDVEHMMLLTEVIDLYEVTHSAQGESRPITVDVLETTREMTTFLVMPQKKMKYEEMAASLANVLLDAEKVLGTPPRVERIRFDIERLGVGSDERASLSRIL